MTLHVPGFFIRLLLTLCGRSDLWSRFAGSLFVDTSKFEVLGWNPLKKTSGRASLRCCMRTMPKA